MITKKFVSSVTRLEKIDATMPAGQIKARKILAESMRKDYKDCVDITISKSNVKIDAPSISVPPVICCPFAILCDKICYIFGMISFRGKKLAESYCKNLWFIENRPEYVKERLIKYCQRMKSRFFRFNVSGDFYSRAYLKIALDVATACPDVNFWAYTKCYQFYKNINNLPENFHLIFSADLDGSNLNAPFEKINETGKGSVAIVSDDPEKVNVYGREKILCPGKCKNCGYQCCKNNIAVFFAPHGSFKNRFFEHK